MIDFETWMLDPEGGTFIEYKLFEGFYAGIKPLMFHWTMIIGLIGDIDTYEKRYCYETKEKAQKALSEWDGIGEPSGWHRSPETGRRRPGGDISKEYIAW